MKCLRALTISQNWPARPVHLQETSTFNQNCPARSAYFYIVCIAVMSFERKLSKEAYFIFKMTGSTGQFGLLVSALNLWANSPN